MRRGSSIAVVALVSALLGGVFALLGAKATGLVGDRTSTLYVPTNAATDLGVGHDEPVVANARPLAGNSFDPARIYAARSPGVVTVFAFFEKANRHAAQGSGFVVSERGYILTSAHVITDAGDSAKTHKATSVYVGFKDGDRVRAEVVGWDVYDDVGLLRVKPAAHKLSPVPLGDSARVGAGDPVAAMGSPFGNEDSIAVGVVSAIHRSMPSLTSGYKVVDAIQTDAPITHGNSGGPLFDARGRVIGINAQIRTETGTAEGVGFAVPINAARRSMNQLAANGRVVYAYLGVTTENLTATLARHLGYRTERGAIVASVKAGSPAGRAGLKGGSGNESYNGQTVTRGGDVIVAIDGRTVRSADDVVRLVSEKLPGQSTGLTILRGGDRRVIRVKLGARPDAPDTNP
ncbi:MAG: trypsin-like peptidase domain-containing protein [Actinomycetota bacterium]|nr:trypsin-like peptidase domain-containing protein [Actinomycetota bacterium]